MENANERDAHALTPSSGKSWKVLPEQLGQDCATGTRRILLDWILDALSNADIARSVNNWIKANPSLEQIVVVQASPSNQVLSLIKSVAQFLRRGIKHHGAVITDFLADIGLSPTDSNVQIDLLPTNLHFPDIPRAELL